MLFCVLPCSCQPFFAVRRHQPDRKSGLVQYIGHATFRRTAFQAAQQRVLPAEILQSAFQAGIEGVNTGNRLALIPVDLSEKNNYPSKSEEYMANQVFYQIFFG